MKLKALHEDILGDLKRKLKGQVSLSDNIKRVAKQELKTALAFTEVIEDLATVIERAKNPREFRAQDELEKILKASRKSIKELKGALKTINRIK